ncbi:MAG: hypothetical protein COV67_13645 [Nitrospinae bacterium CG11_big_fil_rev_8_21_14_0_20_56_8]|nr:MAG: hypothetical protein COV67_13645 [Nitrospinae bacterium CG11_big_fil_rev_8_21_14_0_20_56_8]
MRKNIILLLILAAGLSACSGVDTVVKKRWSIPDKSYTETTLGLVDLTTKDMDLQEAGRKLTDNLQSQLMANSLFVLGNKSPRYFLKYKVTAYHPGSRAERMATFGLMDSAKAELKVKIALFEKEKMVGAWVTESWQKDGYFPDALFKKAAENIVQHLGRGF